MIGQARRRARAFAMVVLAGFAWAAAIAAGPPALPAPVALPAMQVEQAIAALRAISTMRADFEQTDADGQAVSGVFTLKRPRKFLFQYAPGYPLLIVSNGRSLAMIDYETRQVRRWPLGFTPLGALLAPGRDSSRIAHPLQRGDADRIDVLIQDPGHRESGAMTLVFARDKSAPGGLRLDGWQMVDAQNRITNVRLTHHQYGIEVSDETFVWKDPRKASRP